MNSPMYCLSVSRNGHPASGFECCRMALRPSSKIAEFVRRERPAPRFRLNNYLGTHLQVVTDLNAEGPAEAILEIVEIVIGHAATPECVSLRSTHPRRPALEAEHAMLSPPSIHA